MNRRAKIIRRQSVARMSPVAQGGLTGAFDLDSLPQKRRSVSVQSPLDRR
jgi:hypothetical protein